MPVLPTVAGLVLIAIILHETFEAMLLSRRVRRKLRMVRLFFRVTWFVWTKVAGIFRANARESTLSLFGPLSMVLLLTVWAAGLIFGFGLLHWSWSAGRLAFPEALYLSGITFFTTGYGDVVPKGPLPKTLAVFESGSGLGFLAIVIGYLPVLYQLFSRREVRVIQLDARAGSPPTATVLLTRYAAADSLDMFEDLLLNWEQWCAELFESHLSYPVLGYYRSQQDNQSWIGALAAILDASALILVGLSNVRTFQARLTYAAGRHVLTELGKVFQIRPATNAFDRLPSESFAIVQNRLAASGLEFSSPDSAEKSLQSFRSTYEPFLVALAQYFRLDVPPWFPEEEDELDNWQSAPRGRTARQLLESVEPTPE